MAVPAMSEDQAAAVNGFSTSGALVTPSSEGTYDDHDTLVLRVYLQLLLQAASCSN